MIMSGHCTWFRSTSFGLIQTTFYGNNAALMVVVGTVGISVPVISVFIISPNLPPAPGYVKKKTISECTTKQMMLPH